jgi:hypothetical protein
MICIGFQSKEISKYIKRTLVQFDEYHHIKVVARELF